MSSRFSTDAYVTVTRGRAAAVYVCGPSGIGKSALVRSFLGRLTTRDDVVVLAGRCYEHESVPYKALDGVVDSLSRYLVSLSAAGGRGRAAARRGRAAATVPGDAAGSGRRQGLPGARAADLRALPVETSRRSRCCASFSPASLIAGGWSSPSTTCSGPTSTGRCLLEELLRPPDAPALLTVVSFRSEEVAGKPFLQRLLEGGERTCGRRSRSSRCPKRKPASWWRAASSRFAAERGAETRRSPAKRAAVRSFWSSWPAMRASTGRSRVGRRPLPRCSTRGSVRCQRTRAASSRRWPSAAGRWRPELVCAACGVARERQSLVAMLRSSHFIRSSGSSERVETYHDRIREVLAAQIAPDAARRIHRRMVQTLVERRSDDCEALVRALPRRRRP